MAKAQSVDPKAFLTVMPGDMPLILSAPHGGELVLPVTSIRKDTAASHVVVVADIHTDLLALAIADDLQKKMGHRPFLVIAKFSRKYADANRDPYNAFESEAGEQVYNAYHEAMRSAIEQVRTRWGTGLLIDLHGQGKDLTTIFRGTDGGHTVGHMIKAYGPMALAGPNSLFGQMASLGYAIYPAQPGQSEFGHFDGGYIVQTYGQGPIDAIQMEYGTSFRTKETLPKTAEDTAQALSVYLKTYVLPSITAK